MTTEQRLDSIEQVLGAVAATLQSLATTTAANQLASDQRLTRIEAITEQNSTAIDRLEVQVAETSTAIDRLEVQVAKTSTAIDRLEVQVAKTSTAIDRLEVQVASAAKSLEDSCNDLVSMIGRSVEQGDQDRAEIRRILDYLFGQQSNGNGRTEGA